MAEKKRTEAQDGTDEENEYTQVLERRVDRCRTKEDLLREKLEIDDFLSVCANGKLILDAKWIILTKGREGRLFDEPKVAVKRRRSTGSGEKSAKSPRAKAPPPPRPPSARKRGRPRKLGLDDTEVDDEPAAKRPKKTKETKEAKEAKEVKESKELKEDDTAEEDGEDDDELENDSDSVDEAKLRPKKAIKQ